MVSDKFDEKELYNHFTINNFLTIKEHDDLVCTTSCLDMVKSETIPSKDVLKLNTYSHKIDTYSISVTGLPHQKAEGLKETGIDILSMTKSVLLAEANQSITKEYLTKINNLALKNKPLYKGFVQKALSFIYNIFNKIYYPKIKIKDVNEIIKHIIIQSNLINKATRIGPGTFAIMSIRLVTLISDNNSYQNTSGTQNDPTSLYKAGQIAGIEIYVDPRKSWTDNDILIGRSSDDRNPGLILVHQKDATNIQIISERTMAPKTNLTLKYSIIENGLKPEAGFRQITLAKFKL